MKTALFTLHFLSNQIDLSISETVVPNSLLLDLLGLLMIGVLQAVYVTLRLPKAAKSSLQVKITEGV